MERNWHVTVSRRVFRLAGMLMMGVVCLVLAVPANADLAPTDEVIIDFDAIWRYHDGNEDLGEAWREPDYDDSEWAEGPALLGYDTSGRHTRWPEPGLQTEVENNLITYYFRKEFHYDGPLEAVELRLDEIVDDGAVYYLNGVEIGRSAIMPDGEVGFGTRPTGVTNPIVRTDIFEVDASLLREGRNVLAVSVHNQGTSSSDICLGARLVASEPVQTPLALYLTWQQDPTTTMTILWHTEDEDDPAVLKYADGDEENWQRIEPTSHPMTFSDRHIRTAELTGLEPGSSYRFRIFRDERGQSSPFYSFRTMPADASEPIRFAAGGDTRHRQRWMEQTNRVAMQYDVDFMLWGGDLAYADGREDRLDRWYEWFDANLNTLIDDDGRVVPVVLAIGNHEVRGFTYYGDDRGRDAYEDTDEFREAIAPYFYNLFPFPGHPGYAVLDFSDYMSIFLLDSDHSGPIEGQQTSWLEEQLDQRSDVPHVFPIYHSPGFPSHRDYNRTIARNVREHWVPLFERHNLTVVFENDDHTYKRTVPIRDEQEHPEGVVYIGDGAWGVDVRTVHPVDETWYLQRAESIRHLILVTIQDRQQDFKIISEDGKLIDHYIPPSHRR
ncbi:fibronectin type III domain-containing protein [Phycisphaerales bacterium AB-hyl4]|uniref:Fibronectin type III domain-containing protein n=1 Tax=Natronomicrosphaera hydrolytica TaxID=3242702 RepID=A0ABV4U3D8_9BACT